MLSTTYKLVVHSIELYAVDNPGFRHFMLWTTFLYAVGVSILCNMVWTTYMLWILCCGHHVHMPWVTWVMLWVYGVGTLSSVIWCGLPYAVDDSRPQHIKPVVHIIYMVWTHAVGTHELYRCSTDLVDSGQDITNTQ